MKRTPTVLAVAAILATGLACGSGDTDNATGNDDTAPVLATESPKAFLDPDTEAAYLASLRRIDPDIVGDKEPNILVDRGRNQCGSISQWPDDEAKLVDLTNKRFTAPGHPDGFGAAKAKKILKVVREYVCPEVERQS